ncbi:MAG: xanthine dehydrogenase family protein subunit M [Pseudolabrys sp.]|nr:xanthine dehydrogenase family protein subunit M [Pseudolabrys sp.]MCW5684437.1 xanthine dehydrogenase family protein subunit M [Pseudolabrys sp.]
MKPAAFDYQAPTTVEEVVALLGRHGGEARLLAGGQTLVPMMNFRLATPAIVVDLNRIPELAYIKNDNDVVRVGAMTRQRAVEFSDIVARDLPVLQAAIRMVGHLPTRSRGTIGGSIANADAAAEIPMVLQALGGEVSVRGPSGERRIAAANLIEDAMITSLAEDEVLTEVRFPKMAPGARFAVEEFSRRHGDFAIAAVTVVLEMDKGVCASARIATAGVSARSRRIAAAEEVLLGRAVDADGIAAAAAAAAEAIEPLDDRNGSADYRRHLTKVLTSRALQRAAA